MKLGGVLAAKLKGELNRLAAFSHLVGGSAGRLVISLAYFVSVANSLSVADFGLFATASATGIMLSRIAAFGFVSPLYRAATMKPRLVGAYTSGFLAAFALSLPVVALVAYGFYAVVFAPAMPWESFAAVIAAEVLFWRPLEVVCIVNNGLGRFGRAAVLVVIGTAVRAVAAVGFALMGTGALIEWSLSYLAANALSAALAWTLFYPRVALRFRPTLYLARWRDSVAVAAAEILFYVQSELDKLLVLSLGGPQIAGLYAMVMRLVDLTALPVRAFNTMVVQHLMRAPAWLASWRRRWTIEAGIAGASVAGLLGIAAVLWVFPNALGRNVAGAAPLLALALAVPAFRNIVEYHSELLYARGRTGARALILALVGAVKGGLLALLLAHAAEGSTAWIAGLNGLFAVLWLVSASATYFAFDANGRRRIDLGTPVLRRTAPGVSPAAQPGE